MQQLCSIGGWMATAPGRAPIVLRRNERRFYLILAATAAAVVLFGFSRTYFLKEIFGTPSLTPLVHLHGFLFSSWIAVLLTQVSLVAMGRTDLHRRLGIVGALLAVAMLIVGTATAITGAKLGHAPPGAPPALIFLTVPIFEMPVFAILAGTGLYLRNKPQYHKRLMVLATLGIMTAAFGRMPLDFMRIPNPIRSFMLTDLIVLGAISYDTMKNHKLHPAFLWGGLLVILSHPLRLLIGGTAAWMTFARWLTS
jgi:hypothetical protein